jgi:CRP/FNR family cyclic AMP-dependent transcriptional regulator
MLLFQGLAPAELERINAQLRRTTFAAGTALMTAEQPGGVTYLIREGTVKVHIEQADGSDVILAILGPGEILGEMTLMDSDARSANVVTLEESTLLWIDHETLRAYMRDMPLIAENMVRILSRRLRLANAQVQSLATQDVFGRVARQILAFSEEYGRPTDDGAIMIPLRLTQSDLASLVGASRVRVNQVLVHYQQRNYISVSQQHYMTVHDRAALAQRCR